MTEQPINQERAKSPRISRKKELAEAEMAPFCGQMSVRQLDQLSLEKFWQTNDADWPDAQQKLVPELRKWFARKRKNALANFLCGEQVEQLSPEVTLVLTAAILKEFKPRSVGVQVANLMGKLIDRGNFLGLTDLCPPAIAVLTVKRPSPFRSERWSYLDVADTLRSALAESMRKPKAISRKKNKPLRIARIALGQMLVSSMVHGGLIAKASLSALLQKLNLGETPLCCLGERLFIELSLTHGKQTNAEFRRWFPDPLSSVLLMNLHGQVVQIAAGKKDLSNEAANELVWRCISAYLRSVGVEQKLPKTLAKLIDAVKLDLDSRIPMYLSNYAACQSVSHSLKPSAYRRLHGQKVDPLIDAESLSTGQILLEPAPASKVAKVDEKNWHKDVIEQDVGPSDDLESRWLGALRSTMKGEDRVGIILEIDRLLASNSQGFGRGDVGTLFAGFVRWMFSLKANKSNLLAVRTARAYVISVAIRLGGLIGHDISGFGADEWVGLYGEAIDEADTPNTRRKLVRALVEFQNFLEHDHGVEAISRKDVFWMGNGLVPVDANVISDAEFERIRDCFTKRIFERYPGLARTQSADDYAEVAWLILTLAYRCGLRRMEALKLDTVDVLLDVLPELLVRPTQERTLKSKSSTRKLPLYGLLKPHEMERLRQWVMSRIADEKKSTYSRFLFSLPERAFIFVPQDQLFRMLHEVMREVTGDSKMRFHHLRHSFGSRMCVMLAIGERAKSGINSADDKVCMDEFGAQVFATLPGYDASMTNAYQLRQTLLGGSRVTRLNIWAVCELLGHSGPDVSMEHYVHHLDILLAQSMSQAAMAPAVDVVVRASDASSAQAYRHKPDETLNNWAAHLFRKCFGMDEVQTMQVDSIEVQVTSEVVVSKVEPIIPVSTAPSLCATCSLQSIWQLIFWVLSGQRTKEDLCRNHDVDLLQLESWLQSACWIFGLKKSVRGAARRHRFIDWIPDRRYPEKKCKIACPVKPHEPRDIFVASRLEATYWMAYAKDPQLMKRVVRHYVLGARDDCGGMIFTDPAKPEQALEFLNSLKQLGLKSNEISYISYDIVSRQAGPVATWRKALGLHSTVNVVHQKPLNGRKDWACPWLGIVPVFRGTKKARTGKIEASAGFRFVMMMAAISMGMTG